MPRIIGKTKHLTHEENLKSNLKFLEHHAMINPLEDQRDWDEDFDRFNKVAKKTAFKFGIAWVGMALISLTFTLATIAGICLIVKSVFGL